MSAATPGSVIGAIGLPHLFMVLAGLATFVLVSSILRDRSATVDVWVVAVDVPAGVTLEPGDVVPVPVAVGDPLVPSLFASAEGLPSGTVRHGVVAGEPLLASDLVNVDHGAIGRTFTIPVSSIVLDGLGLGRGDRLDVIGLDAAGSMHYGVTDIEVVRLSAVSAGSAFSAARPGDGWVTVRVDDGQALVLSELLALGPIELVRSTGAVAIDRPPPSTTADLQSGAGS